MTYYKASEREGHECKLCPSRIEGVTCDRSGITIEELPIRSKFWRFSLTTDEVLACDHPAACTGSNLSHIVGNDGKNNYGDGLCAAAYEGVLCG